MAMKVVIFGATGNVGTSGPLRIRELLTGVGPGSAAPDAISHS